MITKQYNIMCEQCTHSEGLQSQTLKDCEAEARRMDWKKLKDVGWVCGECYEKAFNRYK